ncbi:MAG: hypothetical protein ABIS21_07720 [Acidimicrobiales bacterium]
MERPATLQEAAMPDSDPDVMVLNRETSANGDSPPPPGGDDRPPAPGATAVFQGMLSVLGEELESLHRGMAAVQRDVAGARAEARAESRAIVAAATEQVDQTLDRRLAELSARLTAEGPAQDLREAVSGIAGRLERLETVLVDRAGEATDAKETVEAAQATILGGLASLEERMVAPAQEDSAELRRSLAPVVERLGAMEHSVLGSFDGLVARLEGLGRLGDGMATLQETVGRSQAETTAALADVGRSLAERMADVGPGVTRQVAELMDLSRLEEMGRHEHVDIEVAVRQGLGSLEARLAQIEEAVAASGAACPASAHALTERVTGVVAKAVGEVAERMGGIEQRLDARSRATGEESATAAEEVRGRLAQLEAATDEGRVEAREAAARVEQAGTLTRKHLAGLELAAQAIQDAPPFAARTVVETLSPAIEDVNDRVARLELALERLVDQADLRSATMASELHGVLATGMERLVTLAARSEESTAAELAGTRARLEAIVSSLADLAADVAGVAEVGRRLSDEGRARPVLEAIDAASRENGEVLAALHSSITRRIDSRVRAIGGMVEGMAAPLGVAASLVPTVEEVSRIVASQNVAVEHIHALAEQMAAALGAVPGGLPGAFGRHEAVLEQVQAALAGHSGEAEKFREIIAGLDSSIGRALEAARSYLGEGLMHVSRRQAGTGRAIETATAALQSMERQLNGLAGLCQSLASGVEQQTGTSARVADLVLETRSALRSDVERLEATVYLEALKLHQQDQARLAGAASTTTEVMEREAAVLAQRISAVAAAVETVRSVLHTHVEDSSRVGSAPLALVRDN